MRQCWWMDLLKDFDCDIQYHLGSVNITADALSRKVQESVLASVNVAKVHEDLCTFGCPFHLNWNFVTVSAVQIEPNLISKIRKTQRSDVQIQKSKELVSAEHPSGFHISSDGFLRLNGRLVVPDNSDLKSTLIRDAHCSKYNIHPGGQKMYLSLRP
ncbi:uncharacterized protein [Primulina eburnea]|uniref:uncharacterized protein n=1 Tax=Primulina eburnea TaxID=1245227 RepID=UPI003C6C44EE